MHGTTNIKFIDFSLFINPIITTDIDIIVFIIVTINN